MRNCPPPFLALSQGIAILPSLGKCSVWNNVVVQNCQAHSVGDRSQDLRTGIPSVP